MSSEGTRWAHVRGSGESQPSTPLLSAQHSATSTPNVANVSGSSTEINHFDKLSQDFAALYLNQDLSDVTFIVDGQHFASHKVILAARSEYFRLLLFGSFKESQQLTNEFTISDTSALAFGALLKYIYTGKLAVTEFSENDVLDILGLAHKYRFELLEESISGYLKISLTIENVCLIYDDSLLYNLTTLTTICKEFLDIHASEVMCHPSFLNLSETALCDLIERDSFYSPELEIFNAVLNWRNHNNDNAVETEINPSVFNKVRLTLISLKDQLDIVRPSGLFSAERILDAIKLQSETQDEHLKYRGCLLPDENVAHTSRGALVIQGEMKDRLLDGNDTNYDADSGHSRHLIDDKEGLVVKLGQPYIINTISLLLWDKDHRSYSYYVEVSVNEKDWVKVCDYSNYLCRSWQIIQFAHRVVRFIRVVGVYNSVNRSFHVVNLSCRFTSQGLQQLSDEGFICPTENVASTFRHASVAEGVSRSRNALINGDTEHYDWDMGYTCHQLGSGSIVIQLCQPFVVSTMRMLLWDCDDRAYSYLIEVSNDQKTWQPVCDRTKYDCKGWQYISFPPTVVTFIKLVGTRNTANEVFHVVHFETPAVTFSGDDEKQSLISGDTAMANSTLNPNL